MKDMFPSYYPLTNEQFSELWDSCLFVPDANVLLDLYRYSPDTRDELIDIFKKCSDRLWVPHQVASEYLARRTEVILTQVNMYDQAKKIVQRLVDYAQGEINKSFTFRLHPFLEKEVFLEKIKNALAEVDKEIDEKKQEHPDLSKDDHIWDTITTLLNGKVGSPYPEDNLEEIYKEGKIRYSKGVPPGYEDSRGKNKKENENVYGDLVIWFQIIDKAKEGGKPIIFITNDSKEDWWWISKGETLGCRPELIDEIRAKADVLFYVYNSDRFMSYAKDSLEVKIKEESINEVRDVRMHDESVQRAIAALGYRSDIESAIKNASMDVSAAKAIADALSYHSGIESAIKTAALDFNTAKAAIAALGHGSDIESAIKNAAMDVSKAKALIDALGGYRPGIEMDTWAVATAPQSIEGAHPNSDVSKSGDDSSEELPEDRDEEDS